MISRHLSWSHCAYKRSNIFKYEAAWDLSTECSCDVKDSWLGHKGLSNVGLNIHLKLRNCKMALTKWKRTERRKDTTGNSNTIRRLSLIQDQGSELHIEEEKQLQTNL